MGQWLPLIGTKRASTIVILTETSDFTVWYQFDDISTYNEIRMNVTATSGSPLFVSGKVIG